MTVDESSDPSRAGPYAWYVLILLTLGYMSNQIDRQILSILIEPIKAEFGASDLMMGLLTGPAFAIFYTFAGIPIARWADRGSRRLIIALSISIWSLFTVLSGLALGFWTLALCRVGVGTGEAGGTPPSNSIISDYFPIDVRARAIGIYGAGAQLGVSFGWLLGGWLFLWLGWRMTFVAVGLPGLALALLIWLTLRDPVRGGMETAGAAIESVPFRVALRHLLRQRSYAWVQLGGALHAISAYGFAVWVAPFLMRVHDMEIHVLGTWLGVITITAGVGGVVAGGWLSDRLTRRDQRWFLGVPILSACVATPFTLSFLYLGDPTWALLAYWFHVFTVNGYNAPIYTLHQAVVKVRVRTLSVAVHLFIVNLVGLGLGPVLVGAMNDRLHAAYGQLAIRYTMTAAALMGLAACVFYLASMRSVREDIALRDAR
jgi:predicted MFS family arabinose efflux permease